MITEQTTTDLAARTAVLYRALAEVLAAAAGTDLAASPAVARARRAIADVDAYLNRAVAEDPKAVLGSRRRNGEYSNGESEAAHASS